MLVLSPFTSGGEDFNPSYGIMPLSHKVIGIYVIVEIKASSVQSQALGNNVILNNAIFWGFKLR